MTYIVIEKGIRCCVKWRRQQIEQYLPRRENARTDLKP